MYKIPSFDDKAYWRRIARRRKQSGELSIIEAAAVMGGAALLALAVLVGRGYVMDRIHAHQFKSEAQLFRSGIQDATATDIHKDQSWDQAGRRVAYPGSIGRFHYGEEGDKGYLLWDVESDGAVSQLVATPSREMVYVEFDGPPDAERLAALAAESVGKFIRVRWQIDEEHKQLVDRKAIEAMFVGAGGLKLEPRVLPVMRSRAEGISKEPTVEAKVARWCELTGIEASPVLDRLQLLDTGDAEMIAAAVLERLTLGDDPQDEVDAGDEGTNVIPLPVVSAEPVEPVAIAAQPSSSLSWLTDDLFAT